MKLKEFEMNWKKRIKLNSNQLNKSENFMNR